MNKLLNFALESAAAQAADPSQEKEKTMVLDGPLSILFARALHEALPKEDPATGTVATESAALDTVRWLAEERADMRRREDDDKKKKKKLDKSVITGVRAAPMVKVDATPVFRQLLHSNVGMLTPIDFHFVRGTMVPGYGLPNYAGYGNQFFGYHPPSNIGKEVPTHHHVDVPSKPAEPSNPVPMVPAPAPPPATPVDNSGEVPDIQLSPVPGGGTDLENVAVPDQAYDFADFAGGDVSMESISQNFCIEGISIIVHVKPRA